MDQLRQMILDRFGSAVQEVYIQPPSGLQMVYPCVTITRDPGNTAFADNNVYRHQKRYLLTGISEDSNSSLYDLLASLPRSTHARSFPADNLNHDVFTIFFDQKEEEE